jgi:hypothetical protein
MGSNLLRACRGIQAFSEIHIPYQSELEFVRTLVPDSFLINLRGPRDVERTRPPFGYGGADPLAFSPSPVGPEEMEGMLVTIVDLEPTPVERDGRDVT